MESTDLWLSDDRESSGEKDDLRKKGELREKKSEGNQRELIDFW